MTQDDLRRVQPEFYSALVKVQRRSIGLILALVVLLGAIAYTLVRGEDTRSVIEHNPCFARPQSDECLRSLRVADRRRSIQDTCISFRRVGYPCPVGEVAAERKLR